MKYAKISAVVRWSGGTMVLNAGVTTADDDHPLVVERPDLWTDAQPPAHHAGPARIAAQEAAKTPPPAKRGGKVETAAQKPGQARI